MIFDFIIKDFFKTCNTPKEKKRFIIAIDGIDASGKTHFSEKLKNEFEKLNQKVCLVHLDNFHNPQVIRYKQGKESGIGFYEDSYNYDVLINKAIRPFKKNDNRIRIKHFNLKEDKEEIYTAQIEDIEVLIVEGIFIHRKELISYWDYSIFLDVNFENGLKRNIERDENAVTKLQIEQLTNKYLKRYKEGQLIYLKQENPKSKANIIIDNNDYLNPFLTVF